MTAERFPRSGDVEPPRTLTEEDFRRLYPKLVRRIRRFGFRDSADVEDLAQETFLAVHMALQRGEFSGRSSLDTWVVSICKNRCLNRHRHHHTQKRSGVELSTDSAGAQGDCPLELTNPEPWIDDRAQEREFLGRVAEHIRELPDRLRQPLLMKARGTSYKQIARYLGIKASLVSSRIHEARSELKRRLAGSGMN